MTLAAYHSIFNPLKLYLPKEYMLPELSGGLNMIFRRWATKKTAGSTKNGRDSNPKYLGVKKFGGEVPLQILHSDSLKERHYL